MRACQPGRWPSGLDVLRELREWAGCPSRVALPLHCGTRTADWTSLGSLGNWKQCADDRIGTSMRIRVRVKPVGPVPAAENNSMAVLPPTQCTRHRQSSTCTGTRLQGLAIDAHGSDATMHFWQCGADLWSRLKTWLSATCRKASAPQRVENRARPPW